MDEELTTNRIADDKFYLGQAELSILVKRIIRHYRYHKNNLDPRAVVIPFIKEVEGVEIEYSRESE